MPLTTSRLFDFLETHGECCVERHEVCSAAFDDLRHGLRAIIGHLDKIDDLDSQVLVRQLRTLLFKWLSVPVQFDDAPLISLRSMGDADDVEARWGRDVRAHFEDACAASERLKTTASPLRTELLKVLRDLDSEKKSFRILCDRRSQEHFTSLIDLVGDGNRRTGIFVNTHSAVDYRETDLFDVLLKVGPFRSQGWSQAPAAILTAPHFHTLIQVVWSGCQDESGFVYDPLASIGGGSTSEGPNRCYPGIQLDWIVLDQLFKDNTIGKNSNGSTIDEFDLFRSARSHLDVTAPALMIPLDNATGILFRPGSRVYSFDVGSDDLIYETAGASLQAGNYLILPVFSSTDAPVTAADEGEFSTRWKTALSLEYQRDPEGLVTRLRERGIDLGGLNKCIEHWCVPATTVIPAPREVDHRRILLEVLGLDWPLDKGKIRRRSSWVACALDEIRRSRGERLVEAHQEQGFRHSQAMEALKSLNASIKDNLGRLTFELQMLDCDDISCVFRFYKITEIDDDYRVPDSMIETIIELDECDQWRE